MAVRTMTTREDWEANPEGIEVVRDYHGHEEGLVDHRNCPKGHHARDMEWTEACAAGGCSKFGPLYMKTTHVGRVLSLREMNGYDDSDFYATVWDDSANKPVEIQYASTRGWTYPNGAVIDATPEVVAKYEAYCAAKRAEAEERHVAEEARIPRAGRYVRVVSGRNVPKGLEGEVFWYGAGKRYSRWGGTPMRVGLRDANGTVHWTAASNVEVVHGA